MKIGKEGWLELDPALDMSDAQRTAYVAYKDAYRVAAELRREYESAMLASAPQGKAYVFGYNFGKASIKLIDASEARSERKPAKATQSLQDFLASQGLSGERC